MTDINQYIRRKIFDIVDPNNKPKDTQGMFEEVVSAYMEYLIPVVDADLEYIQLKIETAKMEQNQEYSLVKLNDFERETERGNSRAEEAWEQVEAGFKLIMGV